MSDDEPLKISVHELQALIDEHGKDMSGQAHLALSEHALRLHNEAMLLVPRAPYDVDMDSVDSELERTKVEHCNPGKAGRALLERVLQQKYERDETRRFVEKQCSRLWMHLVPSDSDPSETELLEDIHWNALLTIEDVCEAQYHGVQMLTLRYPCRVTYLSRHLIDGLGVQPPKDEEEALVKRQVGEFYEETLVKREFEFYCECYDSAVTEPFNGLPEQWLRVTEEMMIWARHTDRIAKWMDSNEAAYPPPHLRRRR